MVKIMQNFTTTAWLSKNKNPQTIVLSQLSRDRCKLNLSGNVTPKEICAASLQRNNSCFIDSGSALTQPIIQGSNIFREMLFGIRGYVNGRSWCSEPAIYIDVAECVGWIETVVQQYDGTDSRAVATPEVNQHLKHSLSRMGKNILLFKNCRGNSLQSKLRARIYGPNYIGQGWFITHSTYLYRI